MSVKVLMDWAVNKGITNGKALDVLDLFNTLSLQADRITVDGFVTMAGKFTSRLRELETAFIRRMEIEPVGFLHLGRLFFRCRNSDMK
jgi:hypothetical protein